MAEAVRIAIVGAESTGKTTLAAQLAAQLAVRTAEGGVRRVAWVPEVLREWCDRAGRTPQAHEQAAILREQHARVEAAARTHEVVLSDTTALTTAVYSRLIFGDLSLDDEALALHRRFALTLLTALDLPWVADGHQRDGEQVREPVDALLRQALLAHRLPFAVIGGSGAARLQQAARAVAPLLQSTFGGTAEPREPATDDPADRRIPWSCACCSVPAIERALARR